MVIVSFIDISYSNLMKKIGILLTNIGSPDSPSVQDVRRYLRTFLSDPRVVRLPRMLWLPILHLIILRFRARYSAELYQNIWTPNGSPLTATMKLLQEKLAQKLTLDSADSYVVECGMHYGNPSIEEGIKNLHNQGVQQLFILPLFPQYSTSTTETTHDQVKIILKEFPELAFELIPCYADQATYITALAEQIKNHHHPDHYLLFSFHGLPQRFVDQGDPYAAQCYKTASMVAASLGLATHQWSLAFQSRFGFAKWLQPYTFERLKELAQKGIQHISIACPGFAVDCLETLEEIQIRGKEEFLKYGGKSFHYIPALNDSYSHVEVLAELILKAHGETANIDAGIKNRHHPENNDMAFSLTAE